MSDARSDVDGLFSPLERQVIVLAATGRYECDGIVRPEPSENRLRAFLSKILPAAAARPLANARLDALRRLTCACFGTRGRPDSGTVKAALAADLGRDEIAALSGLARRHKRQV